jgi:DNA-directed RNA polymerase specialized sigma24 family protein
MPADVFPETLTSWIQSRLMEGQGGRKAVDRHVMEVYAWPLRVYYLGTKDRSLGEPDDVVQGFFADRLAKPEFFAQWQGSGLLLRRWLMNGFSFYLKELRRAQKRGQSSEPAAEEPGTFDGDPDSEMERAFVISIVRSALEKTQHYCEQNGLAKHWTAFFEHFYLERPYSDIAPTIGVDPARAMVMARTVRHRFQAEIRRMMTIDGAENRLDEAILNLVQGART